ncbi:MAG: lysozyme inhibitor LprI family protein [Candidatus Sulfotelmatobacter sp.]|jgi:uncharacterized protein
MRYIVHVLQAASICALSTLLLSARQAEPAKPITEAEIKRAINARSDVDECDSLDQIHIDHLEYYDFTGDGQQEAIVVASTCMTGTAGPDVHAVYTRHPDGTLSELQLLNAKGDPPWSDQVNQSIPVFGNPNYTLTVDAGKLVARWGDSSDRDQPLTVWYRWDGTKFVVGHAKLQGPFLTSYDCTKATKEMDRAICYSPAVAVLDLELGRLYRNTLQKLPADQKQDLQTQQREWLARREKTCTIYKWWVDCLKDLYTKRIADLRGATTESIPSRGAATDPHDFTSRTNVPNLAASIPDTPLIHRSPHAPAQPD